MDKNEKNILRKRKKFHNLALLIFLICLALIWVAILIGTVFQSFQVAVEETGETAFGLGQYRTILLHNPTYLNMYWNSILITVTVVLGSIVVSLLGAYAFTVLRFKGKELLFFLYLVVMLLPLQVTMMPNYMVAYALHIEESYLAIILPAIFNPFGVFVMRQQMKQVPFECVEAAQIDGAGPVQIFFYIFLPMVRSGIMALLMLLVIEYWNLVDQVVIFIRQPEKYPLSVFLDEISQKMTSVAPASSVFYLIPVIALLFYGHNYLKEGIGLMNVKER